MDVAKDALNLLRNTQNLRNATAYGDCLMNGLAKHSKSASRSGVKRSIVEFGISQDIVAPVGAVPLAMDFTALLLCYDLIVLSDHSKESAAIRLKVLSERLGRKRMLFQKNQPVGTFLDYMDVLLGVFASRWGRSGV